MDKVLASDRVENALQLVSRVLGLRVCWVYQHRFHFSVALGWTIAVSSESAGRLRVEACRWTKPLGTVWILAGDEARLAGCVLDLVKSIEESGGELWQQERDPRGLIETSG